MFILSVWVNVHSCVDLPSYILGLNALFAPYVCRRGNFGPLTKTMQF